MKSQDSSDSYDSNDIDLDEIAKMIDPLDDLDKNLFTSKPLESTSRAVQFTSPKKEALNVEKSKERGDNEAEVLTSFSSNNGQEKSEGWGKTLSRNYDQGEVSASGGKFNESARARRRNAKFGSGNEATNAGALRLPGGETLTASTMETGLWSGDDLWKLNGDKTVEPPEVHKSPVKSGAFPPSDTLGKTVDEHSVNAKLKGNKRAGKFDWLGLIGDESEDEKDKGASTRNLDHKIMPGISSQTSKNDIHSQQLSEKHETDLKILEQHHSGIGKGDFSVSKEVSGHETYPHATEPKGKSNKSSLSEQSSLKKGSTKTSESEHPDIKQRTSEVTTKDSWKTSKIVNAPAGSQLGGAPGEENKVGPLSSEKQSEVQTGARRRSLLEENEMSGRGYAPTFLGNSPDGSSSRRRRKREGAEALPARVGIKPDFDPLGLFSIDDASDKVVDRSKSKTPLPDWLTGSSKKVSMVAKDSSQAGDNMVVLDSTKTVNRHVDDELHGKKSNTREVSNISGTSTKLLIDTEKRQEKPHILDSDEISEKVDVSESKPKKGLLRESYVSTGEEVKMPTSHVYKDKKESDQESQLQSRPESTGSPDQSPVHSETIRRKKRQPVDSKVSELNDESVVRQDITSPKGKSRKGDDVTSIKNLHKMSATQKKLKKKDTQYRKIVVEDFDLSSSWEKSDSKSHQSKGRLAVLERQYMRKVRELEEQVVRTEQLEEEVTRMRHLDGEVEHLKAVVHVLELEKSAAESLVESLQARHSEQLQRLEEIHRNEVETLRKALLREEKRGAEEVKRLVEDHRKTLDRLMEANIKLEEEFRTRMLEARRDWNRDVEAMRVAYQQSNNAAITNASLAVLTGHSFGADTKDKSEDDIKDESTAKSVSHCPLEVKELSHTVERVESILSQALQFILPKEKANEEVPAVESGATEKGHAIRSIRKHVGKAHRMKKRKKFSKAHSFARDTKDKVEQEGEVSECSRNSEEEESIGDNSHVTLDTERDLEHPRFLRSGVHGKSGVHFLSKDMSEEKNIIKLRGECKCCKRHLDSLRWHHSGRYSAQDPHLYWNKHDKEGQNMHFRHRDDNVYWRDRKKIFAWKDQMERENVYRVHQEDEHIKGPDRSYFTMSDSTLLGANNIPSSRQSNVSHKI